MDCDGQGTVPDSSHWVATWGQGLVDLSVLGGVLEGRTGRISVPMSMTGTALRVRLSNAFGHAPLLIGAARVACSDDNADPLPGTERVLLFGGQPTATLPPGVMVSSDAADLALPPGSVILVSLYLPQTMPFTTGGFSTTPIALSPVGDFTAASSTAFTPATPREVEQGLVAPHMAPILTGVDVLAEGPAGAIVAFGDSITWSGWPQRLAERLRAGGYTHLGVVNQGLNANRILGDGEGPYAPAMGRAGVTRFREDALDQPGVTHVLVLHGINDLLAPADEGVTARDVVSGLCQYVVQAQARGVRIMGGTITPFGGSPGWSPEREETRQAINAWIRDGDFDSVFDADAALLDPHQPERLLPQYDTGDHLHPNHEGLRSIAQSVDLGLFEH